MSSGDSNLASCWGWSRSATCSAEKLGLLIPRMPGYTIQRRHREQDVVTAQLCEAANLLRSRYGIERGCFKPSKGIRVHAF